MSARDSNAFAQSFLIGFNTVDAANQRRVKTRLLEGELDERRKERKHQRGRTDQMDAEREEDRAIAKTDRDERLHQIERQREAQALLSDPDVPDELLEPYSDIPAVAQRMFERRESASLQQDSVDFHRLTNANAAAQQGAAQPGAAQPGAQQPGNQFAENVVGAAELPEAPGGNASLPIVPAEEINRIADEEGIEAARPLAEARAAAERATQLDAEEAAQLQSETFSSLGTPGGGVRGKTKREKQAIKDSQTRTDTVGQWSAFADLTNTGGEGLRQLDSNILTAQYFDDRTTLVRDMSPQEMQRIDNRMAPHITKTVETQTRIIGASDPATPEARNARRKLSEAYGTQHAIFGSFKPLATAGVDGRGLSTNGTNEALTNAVIDNGRAAPPPPYPDSTNRMRADMTVVTRGTQGRVSEKLAQAAWRLMKDGIIDGAEFDHVMRTGRRSVTAPIIKDHDPKNDLIAVGPQGQVKIIMYARDPAKAMDSIRNTLGDDVVAQMNKWATAYDKESDSAAGTKMIASFGAAVSANAAFLRSKQYDLSNRNDGFLLWQRFIDTAVLKDAVDDEWLLDGKFVDFTQTYGSIFQAMFDPRLDEIDRSELEIPGTTTLGFGGESPQLQPLKPRNPAEIDAALQAMPPGTTREQAERAIVERENAGLL